MTESSNLPALRSKCQAITKAGVACDQPVIRPGFPFCHAHIKYGSGMVKSHDRYTSALPLDLQPHYTHQMSDDHPQDLREEIAMLRAVIRDISTKIVLQPGEDIPVEKFQKIVTAIESVGRTVERQAKVNPERVVSINNVMSMISRVVDILNENIPKDQMDLRHKIVNAINKHVVSELLASSTVNTFPGMTPDKSHE